jgi:hypothetical protein
VTIGEGVGSSTETLSDAPGDLAVKGQEASIGGDYLGEVGQG